MAMRSDDRVKRLINDFLRYASDLDVTLHDDDGPVSPEKEKRMIDTFLWRRASS